MSDSLTPADHLNRQCREYEKALEHANRLLDAMRPVARAAVAWRDAVERGRPTLRARDAVAAAVAAMPDDVRALLVTP